MSYSDFCEKCFGVLYNYEIVFQHKCCTLIGQASKSGVLSGFHPWSVVLVDSPYLIVE